MTKIPNTDELPPNPYAAPAAYGRNEQASQAISATSLIKAGIVFVVVVPLASAVWMLLFWFSGSLLLLLVPEESGIGKQVHLLVIAALAVSVGFGMLIGIRTARDALPLKHSSP